MSSSRRLRAAVIGIGVVRLGAGLALGGAPRVFLRWEHDVPAESSMTLLMRTVGIRDLALGVGTTYSAYSGSTRDVRLWVGAGLLSDALDVGAGLVSARRTGARGVVSALIALPVVVADVWVLSMLREASTRELDLTDSARHC
jgi:hypothetical protein